MKKLTDANFHEEVREFQGSVVVLFSGSWCQPCQKFKPTFEEMSNQIHGIKFMIGDLDDCPEAARELSIRSVPSLAVFSDGMVQEVDSGTKTKSDLRLWIQEAL